MSSQPVRSYLVIAAAIVIAGVLISASLFIAIGGAKTTTITTTSTTTTTVTTSHDSSGLKVIAENLTITFPSGSSSGAAPLANFVANHSGYIMITGPAGGDAYYYVQVVNPLAAENETVPYPFLGPLVIPISPGSITMSLSYRDYGDIGVLNTAHLTIVYYYYPGDTETPSSSSGAQVYAVTFQQVRDCGQYNIMPWAVTIDGLTAVQPSNQSLPLPTNYFSTRVSNQNLTRITLFVPPGTYDYTLSGGAEMGGGFYPTSGTVVVSGSDVIVNVEIWLSITCTSTD